MLWLWAGSQQDLEPNGAACESRSQEQELRPGQKGQSWHEAAYRGGADQLEWERWEKVGSGEQ